MVNVEDFIKRLETVLDYYTLSASSFADKIGVQRSSISHLLSGRNKPSLDFILKILEVFPEVDLYWILNGRGSFPKSNATENNLKPIPISENVKHFEVKNTTIEKKEEIINAEKSTIERIVIFYSNGTFKEYQSEEKA